MMASMVRYPHNQKIVRFLTIFPWLIKFKMVIHCFIDSKSRYVTGIRVSNNNRASTVFDLFQDVIHNHGVPSRVRGDHGTENLMVAQWMEENMGVDRGSYIWGRSVILFPFGLFGIDHILSIMTYRSVHNT